MLNAIVYIYLAKDNIPVEVPDITSNRIETNITDFIIEDGINLTRRCEYDDFQNLAFGECEIEMVLNPTTKQIFIDWVQNRRMFYLLELSWNNLKIFRGYLNKKSVIVDKVKETLTAKFDELLKNFIDFIDTQPLPVINHGDTASLSIVLNTIRSYYPLYGTITIDVPLFIPLKFQNTGSQESSYYRLASFSYRHFNVDNVKYDKYSAKDFLIELLKYYYATLVENPASNSLIFRTKLGENWQVALDEALLEDYLIEYDYKQYDGFIANFYPDTLSVFYGREGWFVYLRNTPGMNSFDDKKLYPITYHDVFDKNRNINLLDLRFRLYSNMQENNASRYIVGYTEKHIVFYAQFFNRSNFYWAINDFRKYYYDLILKPTNLIKCSVAGIDYRYQIGNFYQIDGKICFLIEQKFNFDKETSDLILRM